MLLEVKIRANKLWGGFAMLTLASALVAFGSPARGASPNEEFFEQKVRPLLVTHCYGCHQVEGKRKGGLALDTREGARKGGISGPAFKPGNPDDSLIIKAIRYKDLDLQMPPDDPLKPDQVAILETWIKNGPDDPRELDKAPTTGGIPGRDWWSLRRLEPVDVPGSPRDGWSRTDVDRFVIAALKAKHLAPAKDGDRRVLIRRATFDLTGLPPRPEDITSFVNDSSPDAFAKVVDRLLASPQYGEAWGRHWLDLVRYADTSGCNADFPISEVFQYRNYVINAINQDKPYDQFVREQIAGDLLPVSGPQKIEATIATGYIALSRRFGSRNEENHLTIDDTVDNLGKTFLGLSLGCARCHDHKFDPIAQRDYYGIYGIMASTRYPFPGTEVYRHPAGFVALGDATEVARHKAAEAERTAIGIKQEELKQKLKTLRPVPAVLKTESEKKEEVKKEEGKEEEEEDEIVETPKDAAAKEAAVLSAQLKALGKRLASLDKTSFKVDKLYGVSEGSSENARIQIKGDPKNLGEQVPRGFLNVLRGPQLSANEKGSGRRELARWITDTGINPLMARVMVNRIWQHHFGSGIVTTSSDFGTRGARPSHPELLEHLAGRFVQSGFSLKSMHRLIMLSRAYQMSSTHQSGAFERDPRNAILWRFNRRRLSAEELRDAMLMLSGELDVTPGGEHPFPPPSRRRYTQHKPFQDVYPTEKRSIYMMQQRLQKAPFFEAFDGADPNASTPNRPLSTTSLQALFMMNDKDVVRWSESFAKRLLPADGDNRPALRSAFEQTYGRAAKDSELQDALSYLDAVKSALRRAKLPDAEILKRALASYLRVMFSSNEFMYVD